MLATPGQIRLRKASKVVLGIAMVIGAKQTMALDLKDAIDTTLENSPTVIGQQLSIDAARGAVQSAQGTFDPTLQIGGSIGQQRRPTTASSGISTFETDSFETRVGVSRLLRNGVELTPEIILLRERTTAQRLSDLEPEARATTQFTIRFPLLRGGGEATVLARSEIAELELQAAQAQYLRRLSTVVGESINAYWRFLHAAKALEIARSNETRAERLQAQLQRLVEAGEAPAAELALIEASTVDRRSARLAAESQKLTAESALTLAMGMELRPSTRLTEPSGELPIAPEALLMAATEVTPTLESALMQREDIQAARLDEQAATRRLDAVRQDIRPTLDLSFRVAVNGLVEDSGYLRPLDAWANQSTGPSAEVSLDYRFPIGQNASRGQLLSESAARDQATLRVRALRERAATEVVELAGRVHSTNERLIQAQRAEMLYEQSVNNERLSYQAGMSTLINLIEVEDRYAAARQNTLNSRLEHALAVTEYLVSAAQLVEQNEQANGDTRDYAIRLDTMGWR